MNDDYDYWFYEKEHIDSVYNSVLEIEDWWFSLNIHKFLAKRKEVSILTGSDGCYVSLQGILWFYKKHPNDPIFANLQKIEDLKHIASSYLTRECQALHFYIDEGVEGINFNGPYNCLSVNYIPKEYYDNNLWSYELHDECNGEKLILNHDGLKLIKCQQTLEKMKENETDALNMIKDLLYGNHGKDDKEVMAAMRMLIAPSNDGLKDIAANMEFLPGFGKQYTEAKEHFEAIEKA